jgi:GTP-binding protein
VSAAQELYQLGFGEPLLVSSTHGLGTAELLDRLVEETGAVRPVDAGPGDAPAEIPVAIVGRPNAGKSSLFNAIVGEPRTIVSELAGTTRDAIDTAVTTDEGTFRFIDTAGMRKAAKVSGVEYYSYLRSVQSLDRAHVAVIVADATMRFGELDLSICTEAARNHCATVIVVNKTDIAEADVEEIAGIARRKLRQRPLVIPVSAVTHRGVRQLLAEIASLEARFAAHISTGELNRALATLAADRPLPMKRGKRLKMYYIAQFGTSPPRFAIEVNDRTLVTRDFGFYVENRLRARFELDGVPLVIDFKGKK